MTAETARAADPDPTPAAGRPRLDPAAVPPAVAQRAVAQPAASGRRYTLILAGLLLLGAVLLALLLFTGIPGDFAFSMKRRIPVAVVLVLVAAAGAASTVVFHTITDNRILTPSIMGFDSLFVLAQTALVFFLGTRGLSYLPIGGPARLLVETTGMVLFATLLFRWLFSGRRTNLHVLLLVGVVIGTLFASLSTFMARMLAPRDYQSLQSRIIGSVNAVNADVLPYAGALIGLAVGYLWWRRRHLDVLALGRTTAIGLGVHHHREVTTLLVVISVLVAVSTALMGPMLFFGFLVATLAYRITGSGRHARTIPIAFALGVVALVGGQWLLTQVIRGGSLSVVIEFLGGTLFLILLFRKGAGR